MTSVLVTGATRGLGLATARELAHRRAHVLVSGRDPDAVRRTAAEVGGTAVDLDLARLSSVREALAGLPGVDVVVCNAGLQVRGATPPPTADGFDPTVQVNHLAHLALVDGLLARARPPHTVVMLGSATHDPAVRTGMPSPEEGRLTSYARSLAGGPDGARRYATSKLLTTTTALALAREVPGVRVLCFDPGLMPGTGLAREATPAQRLFWGTAMRALAVLPFASTASASGRALARLVSDPPAVPSGTVLDHRLRPVVPSLRARDLGYQDDLMADGRALLASAGWTTTA